MVARMVPPAVRPCTPNPHTMRPSQGDPPMTTAAVTAPQQDFTHRHVRAFGKQVHRLGLAGNYGLSEKGLHAALERGLNYIFWTPRSGRLTRVLRQALQRNREHFVVAGGPTF